MRSIGAYMHTLAQRAKNSLFLIGTEEVDPKAQEREQGDGREFEGVKTRQA
jgi:hypothetical protein